MINTTGIEDTYLRDLNRTEGDYKASVSGDIESVTGMKNLEQSLLHRLITMPGTLIHRPDYGIGIQLWQNGPLTFEKKRQLAVRIDEQYRRDPRVVRIRQISIQGMPGDEFGIIVSVKLDAVALGTASFDFAIGGN